MSRKNRFKDLDPTLERMVKESADDCGILTSQMREAYHITMEIFVSHVRKKRAVVLPNMGYFFISPYKVEDRILKMFGSMRKREKGEDPEGMTREEVAEKIKKYWEYHQIAMTHYTRKCKRYFARKRAQELKQQKDNK